MATIELKIIKSKNSTKVLTKMGSSRFVNGKGRCILAFRKHVRSLSMISDNQMGLLM
jgi:hypothetical protein